MQKIFFILFLITSLSACSDDDVKPNFTDAPTIPDKAKLLILVNNARSQARTCDVETLPAAPPVKWSEALARVAQKHSEDMDAAKHLSHIGTDGSFLEDRLEAEGYEATVWAENLAVGSPTEEDVVALWLDSPGHCENIMNAQVLEMGVGTSGPYWTMVLAGK